MLFLCCTLLSFGCLLAATPGVEGEVLKLFEMLWKVLRILKRNCSQIVAISQNFGIRPCNIHNNNQHSLILTKHSGSISVGNHALIMTAQYLRMLMIVWSICLSADWHIACLERVMYLHVTSRMLPFSRRPFETISAIATQNDCGEVVVAWNYFLGTEPQRLCFSFLKTDHGTNANSVARRLWASTQRSSQQLLELQQPRCPFFECNGLVSCNPEQAIK